MSSFYCNMSITIRNGSDSDNRIQINLTPPGRFERTAVWFKKSYQAITCCVYG